jgi:Reductase C-terminal
MPTSPTFVIVGGGLAGAKAADPAARAFVAFWLKDQRVVAGMNANLWDVIEPIQTLIRSGWPVDPDRLADPDVPLVAPSSEQDGHRLGVRSP